MATEVNQRGLLIGSDEITDRLLSHISLHMRPETCKQFATGPLRLRENQFNLIAADFPCQSRRINMEVGLYAFSDVKGLFIESCYGMKAHNIFWLWIVQY